MEKIYLTYLKLPKHSVETLFQALEFIQRLSEKPELSQEDVTLKMIKSPLRYLTSDLSLETPDRLKKSSSSTINSRILDEALESLLKYHSHALTPEGFIKESDSFMMILSCDCFAENTEK